MHSWQLRTLCVAILCGWAGAGAAELSEEDELAMAYGDKSFVSIATGAKVPVARAPAVASVITAEDIAASGATDLDEVLESVPGFHVSRSPLLYTPNISIRGIRGTLLNPEVLVLLNGVPLTTVFSGDRGINWGGMPLENIARIEVIRGPGSALYGADAFSGVINLITKTANDIKGTQFGARAGSFDSADAWILHGGKAGGVDVAAYLRAGSTEGARKTITADAQTANDAALGTNASLAPGPLSLGRKGIDGALDLGWQRWRLHADFKQRDDIGSGAGLAQALDPVGRSDSRRFLADLSYSDPGFAKDWDVTLQATFMHYRERSNLTLFPPGTTFIAPFPDGMIGNPYKWERHLRTNASAFYTGLQNHRLRFGVGHEDDNLYKVRETKNFDLLPVPGVGNIPVPLGSVVDVTDTKPFIQPHERKLNYLVVQDEWTIAKDWALTAGVRHDRYSDFGATTNPRVALVWEAAYNMTAKLLYGKAFRAPSFTELYAINNPVNAGNPELKPERIETIETVLAWRPSGKLQLGLNLFRYRMHDLIAYVPNTDATTGATSQNVGQQKGHGLELEAVWDVAKALRFTGNYAYQHSTDQATGQDAGLAPHHHLYGRADWRFASGWASDMQVNHVAGRKRQPGDTRPDVADYTTVDLTLRADKLSHGWEFAVSLRNLFDADAREPGLFGTPVPIPNDLPLPGRSIYLQASYRL
jgi:outer membrane receptor for ferrienterochelin and colicins